MKLGKRIQNIMINYLTKLALIDGLKIIKQNENFFELSESDKKSKFEKEYSEFYPQEAINYFANTSEESLILEIKNILKGSSSDLLEIITKYVILELSYVIDSYYQDGLADFKKNNSQTSQLKKEIISQLESSTYNEICEKLSREIYKKANGKIIIVESPLKLDTKFKAKIRNNYQKDDKLCFVVFKINENILGGIKTYIDGKIIDDSWAEKIEKLEYIGA